MCDVLQMTARPVADRIGFAQLTRFAFEGCDLRPMMDALLAKVAAGSAGAGETLDLSLIVQLLGNKEAGLAIQAELLAFHRLFRSPCSARPPKLRLLALAAAMDMGGNTPIEFLVENSGIELTTLYVVPGTDWLSDIPEHDVAIVVASDSEECRVALGEIDRAAARWPRPLLNPPRLIGQLDRDKLHRLLGDIEGLEIPATMVLPRAALEDLGENGSTGPHSVVTFPMIVRPRGSHAGVGLARLESADAIADYLRGRDESEFFVSRYVDYASADGQFRKYRVVFIDGRPYACHMAIADQWNIWYLNAGMSFSEEKRAEESRFMTEFDVGFGARHNGPLTAMAARLGLDYFIVDCAETRDGALLIFEADNTAVVHDMDSPALFPHKSPQMRRVFDAFCAMLLRRGAKLNHRAA